MFKKHGENLVETEWFNKQGIQRMSQLFNFPEKVGQARIQTVHGDISLRW